MAKYLAGEIEKMGRKAVDSNQMFSDNLEIPIEDRIGVPVLSSSVATSYLMLKRLGLSTEVPGHGSLLSGRY